MNRVLLITSILMLAGLVGLRAQSEIDLSQLVQIAGVYLDPETPEPYTGPVVSTLQSGSDRVIARGRLGNGKWEGVYETYYPNGELLRRVIYRGSPVKWDWGHDEFEEYDIEGNILYTHRFLEGVRIPDPHPIEVIGGIDSMTVSVRSLVSESGEDVITETVDPDSGQLLERSFMRTANPGFEDAFNTELYYLNGQLHSTWASINDEYEGLQEAYWENGQLSYKVMFREGAQDGLFELYDQDGSLRIRGVYDYGTKCGEWFEHGKVVTYRPCSEGG